MLFHKCSEPKCTLSFINLKIVNAIFGHSIPTPTTLHSVLFWQCAQYKTINRTMSPSAIKQFTHTQKEENFCESFIGVKTNVNVYVYSLISLWVQQTSQFIPLVLELSLIRSHLLWGELSVFSAANSIHNSSFFVPPGPTVGITVGWIEMIWEACPTPLHMTGSVTPALVTHPSTNRARHYLTSVIWLELVTTRPCTTTKQERSREWSADPHQGNSIPPHCS